MRGSFTYEDVMYNISAEDKSIIGDIIKENIEFTKKTNISML
jgi:predicted RNA-binding protein